MNHHISILVDDKNSWFVNYAHSLCKIINSSYEFDAKLIFNQDEILFGEICFILSCTNLVLKKNLEKNKHNIVVHPSNLPKGRGFSPIAWDIIGGASEITFCLLEAVEGVDRGPVYLRKKIKLNGYELNGEIKVLQGSVVIDMCINYIKNYKILSPIMQSGEATYYPRRTTNNSELDINQSIRQQFNLLRIVDNDKYPAYFFIDDKKYILKIEKA